MDKSIIEAIEMVRALGDKFLLNYKFKIFVNDEVRYVNVFAFSESQARYLFEHKIKRKKETDVGINDEDLILS
jgi:hypothetical protein